jgi:hypothetical protein
MKCAIFLCALFFVFFAQGRCASAQNGPVFLLNAYTLTTKQQVKLKRRALDGSALAAKQLFKFYLLRDAMKAKSWAIIGAENGDSSMEFEAARMLSIMYSCDDQRRALFWLRKSFSNGYQRAAVAIKDNDFVLPKRCAIIKR